MLLTELYARYKAYVAEKNFPTVDAELESLVRYAPTYRTLESPVGSGSLVTMARQLDVFDMSTAYPLVFVIAEGRATMTSRATCTPSSQVTSYGVPCAG